MVMQYWQNRRPYHVRRARPHRGDTADTPEPTMIAIRQSPHAAYIDYLRRGILAYQYSRDAGRAVFFPRVICPYAGTDCLEWRESSGLGVVYSTSSLHSRDADPYNVALIDMDEGFRLMSRVEGIPAEQVRIGMRVRFRVHTPTDADPYPVFVPADA